jgi:hypothetical protein
MSSAAEASAGERVVFRVTGVCPEPTASVSTAASEQQPFARVARLGLLRGRRPGMPPVETPTALLDTLGVSTAYLTPDLTRKLPGTVVSSVHLTDAFTAHQYLAKRSPVHGQGHQQQGRGAGALASMFSLHEQSLVYITLRPDATWGIFGAPLHQPATGDEYQFETVHGRRRLTMDQ